LFVLARDAVIILSLGALIGVALAVFFTTLLVHPLRVLVQAMRRVQAGDLTVHVPIWAPDEIGEVQAEFNDMVGRLREAREALLEQQRELENLNEANTRLLSELHRKRARLQQLFGHALSAQEAERKRLSRELHDETGQALTSILLRLKALQDETDPNVIVDRLNGLRYLASQTLENVRRLSMDLRPTALDDLGLIPALRWYTQECAQQSGVEIEFDATDGLERLPAPLEIVLYRAVQEGLTNVIRHARAQHVQILLERSPQAVWLTVADDGKGIEPGQKTEGGLGLEGMQERVALAGGHLQIHSQPRAGTRIVIELPLGGEPA
jgi:signal transduction histidine kinase